MQHAPKTTFTVDAGWLSPARQCSSPNQDARPADAAISLLVIHGISLPPKQFGGEYIHQLFCNQLDAGEHPYFAEICSMRVSAHLLIDRTGVVTQFVPFNRRAWHAGVSRFQGRERCNDFSIGIELEGADDIPYSEAQYENLASVTGALLSAFPLISLDRIVGHSDIAPGRKTDPGSSFDWQLYRSMLNHCSNF